MADKGFLSDWCDEQLDLYHAPRATGDPMVDWFVFKQEWERIWEEVDTESSGRYVSNSHNAKKESSGGGITLGQGCILLVVVIAMDWFLMTDDREWSLPGILLLMVAFFGTIFGIYVWFEHMNEKKEE